MPTRSLNKRVNALLNTKIFTLLAAVMISLTCALSAQAQETSYSASFARNNEAISINVLVGQSRVINFDKPIGRFSVSNPEIAEAVLVAPDQVLVNGKAFGQVNFIAWEQTGGRFLVFDVYVRANLSLIDSQIHTLFPNDDIRLSQANGSVVISGSVADAHTVAQVESVVQAAGFKTVNMLKSPVRSAMQVQLQVRVAEVSRNRLRGIGTSFDYQAGGAGYINSGGGPSAVSKIVGSSITETLASSMNLFVMAGNAAAMIRALQTEGALKSLAEPNLIAMDGQEASFLAGGEFPVPVVQSSGGSGMAVSVEFKAYGVRLKFKPTIIDEEHIRLELEPEVSSIDFANGVRFNGFVIPGLRTRRAHTGIELRDGQSFALAGLLDNNETQSLSKVPVISSIPILGALFKSREFQKNETELVFFVTATLVKPVDPDALPTTPGVNGIRNKTPLLLQPPADHIEGQSGYSIGSSNTTTNTTTQQSTNQNQSSTTKRSKSLPVAQSSTSSAVDLVVPSVGNTALSTSTSTNIVRLDGLTVP